MLWYHHFTHVYQRQTEFFVFRWFFALLPSPLMIPKIKILKTKKQKKCLEILSFYTYMCTINEDHMIYRFLKCKVQQTEIFVILGHFCPFSLLTIWKIKILKYTWRYYHFTHLHHKWQSYYAWFLRYGARQTGSTPLWTHKIKIIKNLKKHLKILSYYYQILSHLF